MIKMTVFYRNEPNQTFDMEYYIKKHLGRFKGDKLVWGILVEKGISGLDGGEPDFVCIAHIFYDTMEAYRTSFLNNRSVFRNDMINFTTIDSIDQVSQVTYMKL